MPEMAWVERATYRVQQFWRVVRAGPLPDEAWDEIGGVLSPLQLVLFRRQSYNEQQHGYRVMHKLRAAGYDAPDLLAAALLHDVGKTVAPIRWWDRVVVVLVEALLPGMARDWGQGPPRGWRRPFVVRARHADWGAAEVLAAESTPITVTLVRHHQDELSTEVRSEADRLLHLLQWADNNT